MDQETVQEEKKMGFALRKRAYLHTFDKENIFMQAVLKDLAIFCYANKTTFHHDARENAFREGRRDVWLRIQQFIQLTPEQLLKILGG